jgi:hypothetical protein
MGEVRQGRDFAVGVWERQLAIVISQWMRLVAP